jgi:hypothetical protein
LVSRCLAILSGSIATFVKRWNVKKKKIGKEE